jgi:hypothetical protein
MFPSVMLNKEGEATVIIVIVFLVFILIFGLLGIRQRECSGNSECGDTEYCGSDF